MLNLAIIVHYWTIKETFAERVLVGINYFVTIVITAP